MKQISAISEIPTLLVTSELAQQITTILIEPFNSPEEAEQIRLYTDKLCNKHVKVATKHAI